MKFIGEFFIEHTDNVIKSSLQIRHRYGYDNHINNHVLKFNNV